MWGHDAATGTHHFYEPQSMYAVPNIFLLLEGAKIRIDGSDGIFQCSLASQRGGTSYLLPGGARAAGRRALREVGLCSGLMRFSYTRAATPSTPENGCAELYAMLNALKAARGCEDGSTGCGKPHDPDVLDWDHVRGVKGHKRGIPGCLDSGWSKQRIEEEIASAMCAVPTATARRRWRPPSGVG